MVLLEMWTVLRLAAIPLSPKTTCSTAESSDSIVMTASASCAASLGESATRAPVSASAFSRLRLSTVSSWPARRRFRAMPEPMLPSPMNPIFIAPAKRSRKASNPERDVLFPLSGSCSSLLLDVLLHVSRAHFRAVHIPLRVRRDAFRIARNRPRLVENAVRRPIRDKRNHRPVLRAADAESAIVARVETVSSLFSFRSHRLRFRIGRVQIVFFVDEDPAWAAELFPLGEKLPVLIENLDAIVAPVGDEKASFRIECQRVRHLELPRPRSMSAPRLDELSVLVELDHPRRTRVLGVAVADEDVAIRRDCDIVGLIQRVVRVAVRARRSDRHENLPRRAELDRHIPLAVARLFVGDPDVVVFVDTDPMREQEHPLAERIQKLA